MISKRLNKIHFERGQLVERIAYQRLEIRKEIAPAVRLLQRAENITNKAITYTNKGLDFLIKHPETVVALFVLLLFKKPRSIFRWARRGFFVWRAWGTLRRNLKAFGF